MLGPVSGNLAADDVRALLRLCGELRELGADPAAWRDHLTLAFERLCAASVAMVGELRVKPHSAGSGGRCADAVALLHAADRGVAADRRARFYDDVIWIDHASDPTLDAVLPLYGTAFTRARSQLVADDGWYRSPCAERLRAHDCDDFLFSMAPVPRLGVISSIETFRPWGGRRFSDRERLILQLLHEELARDWIADAGSGVRLTPRQRQVLELLRAGLSEKEIAGRLDISDHTAHDHVKAVYRAAQVRSRGELLARVAASQRRPRTFLAAETSVAIG